MVPGFKGSSELQKNPRTSMRRWLNEPVGLEPSNPGTLMK